MTDSRKTESLLFWSLVVVCAAPIWLLPSIPTQDGPAHLYNAYLLHGWWRASFPIDRSVFALNPVPVPNSLSTVTLALLMQFFSPDLSEKVLLTTYAVLFPVSLRYAARAFDEAPYVYFLGFPLVWNYLLLMGFFNFCFSLAGTLVLIGYYVRRCERLAAKDLLVLWALSCLLYFSNGLSFYFATGTVGLLAVAKVGWSGIWKSQIGLVSLVPLSLWYLASRRQHASAAWESPRALIWSLARLSVLLPVFSSITLKLSMLFGLFLVVAGVVTLCCRHTFVFSDALLFVAAGEFVLYFLAPKHVGGVGFLNHRMMLAGLTTFVLWVAVQRYSPGLNVALALGGTTIFLALLWFNVRTSQDLVKTLTLYRKTGPFIEEGHTLRHLQFDRGGYGTTTYPGLRYDPFMHAGSLVAIDRNLVDLNNYEAASGNFPIIYKDSSMDGRADYIIIWDEARWDHPRIELTEYTSIYRAKDIPLEILLDPQSMPDGTGQHVPKRPL